MNPGPGKRFRIGKELLTIKEIAKRAGITGAGVRLRIAKGLLLAPLPRPEERSERSAAKARRYPTGDGRHMSARAIAFEAGASPHVIRARLAAGVRGPALFAPSPMRIEVRLELVEKIEALGKLLGRSRSEVVEIAVAELDERVRRPRLELGAPRSRQARSGGRSTP